MSFVRAIRILFLFLVGICLVVIAVANRSPVTLRLLPDELAGFFPSTPPIQVPLFLVIFGGIVLGLLIGFVWEWIREHKHRAEAAAKRSELARLETEAEKSKKDNSDSDDEILALLERRAD